MCHTVMDTATARRFYPNGEDRISKQIKKCKVVISDWEQWDKKIVRKYLYEKVKDYIKDENEPDV